MIETGKKYQIEGKAEAAFLPVTTTIFGNEPAMSLCEVNEYSAGQKKLCRYQIIEVIRSGKVAQFRRNMGDSKQFKGVKQLFIPALLEYTVDELLGVATELRYETEIDIKELCELDNLKLV